jgi:hypothetical protein
LRLAEGGLVKRNQVAKVATAKTEAKPNVKKVSKADIILFLFILSDRVNLFLYLYISLNPFFQPVRT